MGWDPGGGWEFQCWAGSGLTWTFVLKVGIFGLCADLHRKRAPELERQAV